MEKKVRSWTVIQKLKDRFLPKKTVQNSKEPEEVRHERTPSIRLNVVDMLTDRTVTLDFPTSFRESDVLKLAFPSYNATGLIWEFRQGRLAIKDLRLADGDTLYVRIPDLELIRGNGLQELYFQSYTVSFRRLRQEDDLIEIRYHGYDTKKTLEARLNSKVGKKVGN